MKHVPKTEIFSLFSIVAGCAGMAMQTWLFSTADVHGLLDHGHISGILSYLLLAAVLTVSILSLKNTKSDGTYDSLFPRSIAAAVGCWIAAVGMGAASFIPVATGFLRILVRVFGALSTMALGYAGYCRFRGLRPNCLIYAAVAVYLIFRTLTFCQVWSADVQVQHFFFPLLGSLSLLMAAYYRAALGADLKNCREYLFFRQLALFCCLLSLAGGDRLFFFSGAVWMATDFCIPSAAGKYTR